VHGPPERAALYAGPAAVAAGGLAVLAAALLSPSFTATGDALSNLGARGASTAPIFNGGLLLAGLLGLPFIWRVSVTVRTLAQRVGLALLAGSLVAMALVGLFPLPRPEHGPAALAFFALFTVGLVVVGTGDVLAGRTRRGLAAIWLGVAHPTAWGVWALAGPEGIAIPEVVGAATLGTWVLVVFRSLRA
jgi:hypothetical membrane protein